MMCPRCKGSGEVAEPSGFAARLIMLRETRGLTCKDIEQFVGIPHSEYWRLENGKVKNPSIKTLVALARYFGVTTDYMLGLHPSSAAGAELSVLTPLISTSESSAEK